ncbi:MAG: 3-phosphoshikimate 1-carboxyvinyltransferase [Bacilli bacterium]
MDLKIYQSKLKGDVVVPASKSITHRYLICAALSSGKTIINNPLICNDTLATISVLKKFGTKFKFEKDRIIVKGSGIPKYTSRKVTVLESATTLRILLPLMVLFSSKVEIVSSKRLIDRIYTSDLLDLHGLHFQRDRHNIRIDGKLVDKNIVLSGKITTQLISGILFALPYLEEGTTFQIKDIAWTNPYIELTLDAMKTFGINFQIEDDKIKVSRKQKYMSKNVTVEGDYSNGAVWVVASYFHHDLNVLGLNVDSLQGDRQIISYMNQLGVNFNYTNNKISYASGELTSGFLNVNETPDLAPILVSLASNAQGRVIITGTAKLKYKESNRKLAIMEVINALGGDVKISDNDIIIDGKATLNGKATIDSYNDHRIVMATAIMATICNNPVIIKDFQAVNKSYPDFFKTLVKLGAKIEVL